MTRLLLYFNLICHFLIVKREEKRKVTLQYNPALLDIVYTTAASVYIATYYRNTHSDSPEPS